MGRYSKVVLVEDVPRGFGREADWSSFVAAMRDRVHSSGVDFVSES